MNRIICKKTSKVIRNLKSMNRINWSHADGKGIKFFFKKKRERERDKNGKIRRQNSQITCKPKTTETYSRSTHSSISEKSEPNQKENQAKNNYIQKCKMK